MSAIRFSSLVSSNATPVRFTSAHRTPPQQMTDIYFGRRSTSNRIPLWKRPLITLIAVLGIAGGGTVHVNNPPQDTVATARESILGIPAPWPSAYLVEDGDVIGPLVRIKKGHISKDGKARNIVGLAKGEATPGGKIYPNLIPIEGASILPSGTINKDGTVYGWPIGLIPEGYIYADPSVSTAEKGALALWVLDDNSSSSSSSSSKK